MLDGNEAQQVLDFALSHKIIFASAAGTVVTFGFLAGRYVFDRQLSILNQENQLIEERLRKAQAELDASNRALAKSDPLTVAQIKSQKAAADRGAAFRFIISVAALLTLFLSGGCVYMLNEVSIRENQHYADEAGRQNGLAADVRNLEALLKPKPIATPPGRPKQAAREPASKSASK